MPIRLYYLDDELELLEMFTDIFASKAVDVSTFNNPDTLFAECSKNPPDLLFLDYRMPGTTGDLVAQRLDPMIPKFLVTGDLQVATSYPFKKIIHKPFDDEIINQIILEYTKPSA